MLLALVVIAITVGLAYRGWHYYLLDAEERVEHPDYKLLRSHSESLTGGLAYGWVAAVLIVLNLGYLIRRRFGGSGFGKMQTWLDIHVFTGLTAASLVSFHSAFQLRTPVATLSTASLGLVVLTGLIGRFLFALAPAGGRERLRDALDALEVLLPGHRDKLAEAIALRPGPEVPANASLLRSLFAIPKWRRASKDRSELIDITLPPRKQLTGPQRRAVKELRLAAIGDARASGMSALLRTWRGLHRLFALLMLAAVFLHAGVAWYIGYRWIFG
jgi:hypothetical protein